MDRHSSPQRSAADPQLIGLLGDGLLSALGLVVPDPAPARRHRREPGRNRLH
jgi:hypothetical protein